MQAVETGIIQGHTGCQHEAQAQYNWHSRKRIGPSDKEEQNQRKSSLQSICGLYIQIYKDTQIVQKIDA